MNKIKIFAPASVANVSCGFDVLGFAFDAAGDEIEMAKKETPGVVIESIEGPGNLSTIPEENICGVVAMAMLEKLKSQSGVEIRLKKGILPGSGMGSSAASSAGTAFALQRLFGNPFNETELVEFAMLGEKLASGTAHADNVSPCLLGGFTLVRSYEPLDIIGIPVPENLFATVIHPQIELKTELSRNVLRKQVELKTAIRQWGNIAGLVAGLYRDDYGLIGRSMDDYIVEPVRSLLIPGFSQIKNSALQAGALGVGISGSGPSVFALSEGEQTAAKVAKAMEEVTYKLNIESKVFFSKISKQGCRVI